MAKEEEVKEDADAKGGGKKKLIIIIVPVVLLLAGAGWWFFLKPSDGGVAKPLPEPTPGVVVKLDSITINLAGAHFLKLGIALQPTAAATELDGSEALDLAISEFSQMTIAELSTAEGRTKAKDELLARIKLTYVPEGTDLALVTSLQTTFEAASKEEAKAVLDAKTQTDAQAKKAEIHIDKLSAGDAIKRANSLSVQPEVYDIYFTEFLMQ